MNIKSLLLGSAAAFAAVSGAQAADAVVVADPEPVELTPAPYNVRSRVHEYGGGAWTASGGIVVFTNLADMRLYRLDPGSSEPVAITPEGGLRYANPIMCKECPNPFLRSYPNGACPRRSSHQRRKAE